ncbi:MAG: hypothetical protein D6765_08525 [Bacteroidetes bacterium]|nr:MAG: hypothetical protein D6765_08525 [Bacteroidota bacterium]
MEDWESPLGLSAATKRKVANAAGLHGFMQRLFSFNSWELGAFFAPEALRELALAGWSGAPHGRQWKRHTPMGALSRQNYTRAGTTKLRNCEKIRCRRGRYPRKRPQR